MSSNSEQNSKSIPLRDENYYPVLLTRLPLWPSGQSSWLQIQRFGFDFRRYQIFWEVVGLERGLLKLVSTIEELLGRKSSSSGPETENTVVGDPPRWPRGILYPQKLALTSLTSGGRSVGIDRSLTHATEFSFFSCSPYSHSLSQSLGLEGHHPASPRFFECQRQSSTCRTPPPNKEGELSMNNVRVCLHITIWCRVQAGLEARTIPVSIEGAVMPPLTFLLLFLFFYHEDEGNTLHWSVCKYASEYKMPHFRR
jgi:hypothetical protein